MEEYWKDSKLTQRKYNLFNVVKIINIQQAMAYIKNGVYPVEIEVSQDRKTGNNCFVFLFQRDETKEVYDKWCKYELR